MRLCLFLLFAAFSASCQVFQLPTANHALFEVGGEQKFFVGTVGKPWLTGTFGCVRTDGAQFHEGLDIRSLQHDAKGEPTDAVQACADGVVAYFNTHAGLSNYGKYIILRHQVEGLEIFSFYAHLREFRSDLKIGLQVRAGEPIAIMGRTANTQQSISKDRAHVHFELDLVLNDQFATWHKKAHPGERNDHGNWNGQNLIGLDPRAIFMAQQEQKDKFSLLSYIRRQPELCRVIVRAPQFPYARRYAALIKPNPIAQKEGIAGYELALNFNGLPFEMTPRAASEIKSKSKFQLLAVNDAERGRNPCGHLVINKKGRWELTARARNLLELLTY